MVQKAHHPFFSKKRLAVENTEFQDFFTGHQWPIFFTFLSRYLYTLSHATFCFRRVEPPLLSFFKKREIFNLLDVISRTGLLPSLVFFSKIFSKRKKIERSTFFATLQRKRKKQKISQFHSPLLSGSLLVFSFFQEVSLRKEKFFFVSRRKSVSKKQLFVYVRPFYVGGEASTPCF